MIQCCLLGVYECAENTVYLVLIIDKVFSAQLVTDGFLSFAGIPAPIQTLSRK